MAISKLLKTIIIEFTVKLIKERLKLKLILELIYLAKTLVPETLSFYISSVYGRVNNSHLGKNSRRRTEYRCYVTLRRLVTFINLLLDDVPLLSLWLFIVDFCTIYFEFDVLRFRNN